MACRPSGFIIPPPTSGGETWLKTGPGGNLLQPIAEQQFCLGYKRLGPCACFPPEGSEEAETAGRHSSVGQ